MSLRPVVSRVVMSGDEESVRIFRRLRDRVEDVRPAWKDVGDYLRRRMREQFATEGRSLGRRWDPLSPSYRARKAGNKGILDLTGGMRRSFTTKGRDHIEHGYRRSFVFGSRHKLAPFHQEGTRQMPQRPILYAGRGVRKDINRMLEDYIVRGDL